MHYQMQKNQLSPLDQQSNGWKKNANKIKQSLKYIWDRQKSEFLLSKKLLIPHHETDHWILISVDNFPAFITEFLTKQKASKTNNYQAFEYENKIRVLFFDSLQRENIEFYNRMAKHLLRILEYLIMLCIDKDSDPGTRIFLKDVNYTVKLANST